MGGRSACGPVVAATLAWLCACAGPPPPADVIAWTAAERALITSLSPVPPPPPSPGNRVADDPGAAAWGQALFFDRGLSANGQIACVSCHVPALGFADGRPLARGLGDTSRHAPTVVGAAHGTFQFWDGRKDSLWSQALGPLESPAEHGTSRSDVARHIVQAWRAPYEALFGPLPAAAVAAAWPRGARPVPDDPQGAAHRAWLALPAATRAEIDRIFTNVGKAIEAYERRLQPGAAPFDRFAAAVRAGDDGGAGALDPAARRGLRAFLGPAGCVNCHSGPLFTDKGFHNLGLPRAPGASGLDVGRTLGARQVKDDPFSCGGAHSDARDCRELRYLNPTFDDFLGAFKTPSLRTAATTAPYMHDGRFATLAEVVAFYKERPGKAEIGHRDLVLDTIAPDQVATADLVAFLQSLQGPPPPPALTQPPPETP